MIEAHHLTRSFGMFTAISQVSLHVADGTILALLGPNGSGKTTTVRILSGLLAPTEGEAIVAGYDIHSQPDAVRAHVGLVTDVPGLYEQMKVTPYLEHFGSIYGIAPAERNRRIDTLLELFELDTRRHEKMAGFSKGMKQKVAIARALIHEPPVLFLDEPTAGLDPIAARTVRELIVRLKRSNRSIILCTHDLDEAERLADQVAIMRQGRIVACDTPAALRSRATAETSVRVEFASACPVSLETLQAIAGINTPHFIAAVQSNSSDGHLQYPALAYSTAQPEVVNPQVLARLVMAGAQVVSVECATLSLEDVYASAMGKSDKQQTGNDSASNVAKSALMAQGER